MVREGPVAGSNVEGIMPDDENKVTPTSLVPESDDRGVLWRGMVAGIQFQVRQTEGAFKFEMLSNGLYGSIEGTSLANHLPAIAGAALGHLWDKNTKLLEDTWPSDTDGLVQLIEEHFGIRANVTLSSTHLNADQRSMVVDTRWSITAHAAETGDPLLLVTGNSVDEVRKKALAVVEVKSD